MKFPIKQQIAAMKMFTSLLLFFCFVHLNVSAQAPTSLQYPTTNLFEASVTNVRLAPTVSGNVASYSITPALPAGLAFNTSTGIVSGVPTAASALTSYTITATNGSGSTTCAITITITNSYYDNANAQVSFPAANTVLKVGTGMNVGDIVLFTGVTTASGQLIDCIVTTRAITNVTAWTAYDQPAATGTGFTDNDDKFFSPQVTFGASPGGSVIFDFQFILGGSYVNATNTGTNVILRNVKLNTYDIDGNGTAIQHVEFGGFSTSELGTTTNIVTTFNAATQLTRYTSNTAVNTPAVLDPTNRIRVNYNEISKSTITIAANNSGLAYYFIDFSAGGAFTTNMTNVPSLDLNTLTGGVNYNNRGCGTLLSFSGGASQTNASSPTDLLELSIEFPTASILNGASERLVISGATAGSPIAFNFANGASIPNVVLGSPSITYSVTATVAGGLSKLSFQRVAGNAFTTAKAEELVDALNYENIAVSATNGQRVFTVNLRNTQFKSPDALFLATVSCVNISGNVYHDANALTDNLVNPNSTMGQFAANSIYAVLVDNATGLVLETAPISAGGAYSFGTTSQGKYNLYFSTSNPALGSSMTASTLPANYITTGENLGAGVGNDLTVDSKIVITVGTVAVTNANFGLQIPPTATATNQASSTNPGGFNLKTITPANFGAADADGTVSSITISSFPTNTNVLKVGTTFYTNGGTCPPQVTCTAWPGTLTIPYAAGAPTLSIAVDPVDGANTVNIPYYSTDNGNANSPVANLSVPFSVLAVPLTVSGNVWNDVNGDGTLNGAETLTNVAEPGHMLYAVLVQTSNTYSGAATVYASTAVSATTGYNFPDVPAGNDYEIRIVSLATAPVNGSAASGVTPLLPLNYVGVSTNNNGTITTGLNTNSPTNTITGFSTSVPNVNFGIEQPPSSGAGVNSAVNPNGTVQVTVPANTFTNTTLSSDPSPGAVTAIRITAFPTGATTIVINGVSYTSATFPGAGVVVPTDANGNPTQTITVDPTANGATSVSISFKAIDAAGKESANTGTAVLNLVTPSISGNVFNDANGLIGTPTNTVDGTGTNVGGTLYANLINSSGNVVATTLISATGTYSFDNVNPGDYSVQINTMAGTISSPAPTVALPAGWVSTGEYNGAGAGSDGTPNGISATFTVAAANVTNVNFGIERLPTSNNQTYNITSPTGGSFITLNGTGTTSSPGPLTGSDPEDQPTSGTLSGKSVIINTLPTNGNQLFYNGVQITTTNFSIANYDPSLLQIKFTGTGSTSTSFTYSYVDAAGKPSTSPATYSIDWATVLPVKLISFTAFTNGNAVNVAWEVTDEVNVAKYEVLYSTDGVNFMSISIQTATGNRIYGYVHSTPVSVNYYRIRIVDADGKISLSDIRKVSLSKSGTVVIYPNPATSVINLSLTGDMVNKSVKIIVIAADGKIVLQSAIAKTSQTETLNISNLAAGIYVVSITTADAKVVNTKVQVVK